MAPSLRESRGELPPADTIQSKAFTINGALAFVEERFGPEARQRVIDASPPAARELLGQRLLPSQWVPFSVQVELYETIDRVFGAGDLELCWEIGRFTSDYEMSRFHKTFLQVVGLDIWVRTAGLMWGLYYSVGKLNVGEIRSDGGSMRVERFNPISRAFCHDFGGWIERTVSKAKYEGVEIDHRECVLDGAEACLYLGTWRRAPKR